MASTCLPSFTGQTQKNSAPRLFSGTQEAMARVFAARDRQRFGFGGKRSHHVIVERDAAHGQIPAALRGQIHPAAPGRVGIAQHDAGAAAPGYALHPGQDGVQHRLEAARLQQQAVHFTQGLQVGVLGAHPLRAAIERLDQ